jgi:uncharacterized protein
MLTVKLDDIPPEGLSLTWVEEKSSLSTYIGTFAHIDFDFDSPLQGEARIDKAGQSVLIQGKVHASLRFRCVRCLKEFSYPLSSTFELTLHPLKESSLGEETELSPEDMESNFFEGEEIHLSEIACEQIFLDIPYQPLCQEACKGLCPVCGKDLNLGSCSCAKEEFPSGFAALQKLKLDS